MKTQKRFVISGMFKTLNILGICLILVALVAPTAHAETVVVDPGNVGGEAQNFNFENNPAAIVDLVWSDNKTLEWEAGTHLFFLGGQLPCANYAGVLLDESGDEIPDTELIGKTQCLAGSEISSGVIDLPETTVFSGIRLSGAFDKDAGWSWHWDSNDRPVIGETQASGNQAPTAEAGGEVTGEVNVAVAFDGRNSFDPDGEIVQYDWDFGDNTPKAIDAGPTPSYTYAAPGSYNVILTVTDDGGLPGSDDVTANIAADSSPPTANAGNSYEGTEGEAVTFNGSLSSDPEGPIAQYDWDFGDNTPKAIDAGPTPIYTYANNGEYTVTLTVTDSDGETDDDIATATILIGNLKPTADAGPPAEGVLGDTVSFNGGNSRDPDGTIAQYDWDFGDNTTGTGENPSHLYAEAGEYTVHLTVTDNDGAPSTAASTSATIDANPVGPTANAGDPVVGTATVAVSFNGGDSTDADGTITQYDWDFDDGNTGTGVNPSHAYAAAGSYTVTLTVTDNDGLTNTDETQAAIDQANTPPTSDAGGPYAGAMGARVLFNGSASSDSDGSIDQCDWDFDDGTTGSGLYSIHTYTAPGSYTARLIVTDNDGDTDESTAKVIIGDAAKVPPRADANGPYDGVAGVPLTLDGSNSTDPDGTIDVYSWTFGDGNSVTGSTPDNTYTGGGLYSLLLHVTDDDGLTASDVSIARIGNLSLPPNARLNTAPLKGRVGVAVAFDASESSDPDGTINRNDWEFGDGNIASNAGATPTHVYATDGSYIARLTVTDDSGETDTNITVIHIGIGNLPPLAHAGDAAVSGKVRREITFNGTGSSDPDGDIVSYAWEFGDGNTGTGPNPTHSYAVAGKYFVALTVTDSDGSTSSDVVLADVEEGSSGGSSSDGPCFINTIMGK